MAGNSELMDVIRRNVDNHHAKLSDVLFRKWVQLQEENKIGEKETLIGSLRSGNNNLSIKPSSKLGLIQNSSFESIYHEKGENRFFIISLDSGFLKDTIMLVEVSEEVWRAKARR